MNANHVRIIMLVSGALTAVIAAVSDYLGSGQTLSLTGLSLAAGMGLIGWASKAPGTLTKAEAQAHTEKTVRSLSLPADVWHEPAETLGDALGMDASSLVEDDAEVVARRRP